MSHQVRQVSSLQLLAETKDETIDLIYVDPPFGTNNIQSSRSGSYTDPSSGYDEFVTQHLKEFHRVLKPTGAVCLHLDWHQVHVAKLACDRVFGIDSFLNEIIWAYDFGGRGKDRWPRKHDNILVYVKSNDEHVFNWNDIERIPYMAPSLQKDQLRAQAGKVPTDVWWMSIVGTASKERTGYPTQKPVALVERFIVALTPKDGIVMDCFVGSGTTVAAAIKTGRCSIACDVSDQSLEVMRKRFGDSVKFT